MAYTLAGVAGQNYNQLTAAEQAQVQATGDAELQRYLTAYGGASGNVSAFDRNSAMNGAQEAAQRYAEGIFTQRSNTMAQQNQQSATDMNSFIASNPNASSLPTNIDPTGQYAVVNGVLTQKSAIAQNTANQAGVANGTLQAVQIGTGTGYVPVGSAAQANLVNTGTNNTANAANVNAQTPQQQLAQQGVQQPTPTSGQPAPGAPNTAQNAPTTGAAATTAPSVPMGQQLNIQSNLGPGSRGAEVSSLQQFLISKGFQIPDGATGYYGPQTKAAVEAWQRSVGIQPTSQADFGYFGPISRAFQQGGTSGAAGGDNPPAGPGGTATSTSSGLTQAQQDYANSLQQQDYDQLVTSLGATAGLPAMKASITASTAALQALRDKKVDEANGINNNPWLSEELRGKKIANLEGKYDQKEANLLSTLQLTQKQYEDAQQEIQFRAKMQVEQNQFNKTYELKVKELAASLIPKPVSQPASVQEYEYAKNQGFTGSFSDYQNEDANRKISIAKAGAINAAGLNSQQSNTALKLSDDYEARSKEFYQQRDAYNRIVSSASNPSAAGDLALIFNYMKVLDPGSTVREGEFANAQNAGSAFTIAGAKYNKILNGERLTQGQRNDFVNRATTLFNGAKTQQDAVVSTYTQRAGQYSVPANLVVRDTSATGSTPMQNQTLAPLPSDNPQTTGWISSINNFLFGN